MMFAAVVPKPRVTWLVDSNAPTAIATMAVRRAIALRDDADSTVLALHCPISTWPAASPLASIRPVCLTHELTDDPEVVVTSSPQTLAWADQHIHADIPRVHFLPTTASAAMANETFMMRAATLARLCVAPGTDTARVAEVVGLPAQNVQCHDDFTLAEQVILSSATNPVIVAIGALTRTSGLDVLIQGFALARDHLPRWQLRIYGRGPLRGRLEELIREQDIGCAVHLMGYAFDPSVAYAEASVAAHLATRDSSGLPLYEALSAGVPVLVSRSVPAAANRVLTGRNGTVLERVDPTSVGAALADLADPDRRAALAGGARRMDCGLLDEQRRSALRECLLGTLSDDEAAAGASDRIALPGVGT